MKITLNTTSNTKTILSVGSDTITVDYVSPREQDILKALDEFLQELGLSVAQCTEIEVSPGPGSFTSIRTGISVAQSLSLALQIPINGQPPGSTIEAEYGKPASITAAAQGTSPANK